ncbi:MULTISPECIES: hypothetical protein [unclassified Streptomyces]|uniref:hypothetical protein n=1 Tax=unclassified Streptomyces TaxID=2593676 RepID=UPI002B1CD359|nr:MULTISPECIES: hypothetical protein [unclassified Streptomyces]
MLDLVPADASGGRGLLLVEECADSWGGWVLGDDLLGRGAGKPLWFEVRGDGVADRRSIAV